MVKGKGEIEEGCVVFEWETPYAEYYCKGIYYNYSFGSSYCMDLVMVNGQWQRAKRREQRLKGKEIRINAKGMPAAEVRNKK